MAKLVKLEQVGINFTHQVGEKWRRFGKIVRGVVHPFQAKGGGMVLRLMEMMLPRSLIRERNLAEGDQGDADAAGDQAGDQFARVGPRSGHGSSSDQNVARPSQEARPAYWMRH